MAFEQKQLAKQSQNKVFWTIFKYYAVVIPMIYLLFLMPSTVTFTASGPMIAPSETFNLMKQLLLLGIAGIVRVIDPKAKAKNKAGDHFMKMIMAQQLLANNLFEILLVVLAWNEFPRVLDEAQLTEQELKQWHFKNKTIYILLGIVIVLTLCVAFVQWKYGKAMGM
ncbi:hypothetical protein [Allofustis seminis]|uniref:hypothetical protein n=1 Tax=Allofustis seminis TaxID=166939 RepID=UPI00035DB0F6|nr:hypothetical protein [Allofustis seminis]